MNRASTLPKLSENHRALADIVFENLRDSIIEGRLESGQWLRQETLAQELGVSEMPVREALKRLEAEGLAKRIPYKGVKVVEFSAQDIVDISTNRFVLESLAIRLAAPIITDEELEHLENILNESDQCTDPERIARRRELNMDFHISICKSSRRDYLVRLVELVWKWFPSVMLYEGMLRQRELLPKRLEQEKIEHWAILDALRKRDAQLAEDMVRSHVQNLSHELIEILGIPEDVVRPLDEL